MRRDVRRGGRQLLVVICWQSVPVNRRYRRHGWVLAGWLSGAQVCGFKLKIEPLYRCAAPLCCTAAGRVDGGGGGAADVAPGHALHPPAARHHPHVLGQDDRPREGAVRLPCCSSRLIGRYSRHSCQKPVGGIIRVSMVNLELIVCGPDWALSHGGWVDKHECRSWCQPREAAMHASFTFVHAGASHGPVPEGRQAVQVSGWGLHCRSHSSAICGGG